MLPIRLLSLLALLALATGCDSKPPTGPSGTPPSPAAGEQRSTGPIAFVSDRDGTEQIYLANEDGSAVTRLTPGAWPTWSRDGQRLAFYNAQGIYVINVDGSGLQYLAGGWEPDWSPDGRFIVFRDMTFSISTVEVNGSNLRRLYESGHGDTAPAWSPDGQRIAFDNGSFYWCEIFGLWVMNADGSGLQYINCDGELPAWSPDSSEIAFVTPSGIDVSNADGSGRRTRVAGPATFPDWTPDGRLIFTKSPSRNRYGPDQRIFISDGGLERQLIPEAKAPARSGYSDRQATWRR
jgi:Tol biopolymer transport system component